MELKFDIQGRKTFITINGKTKEHKTAFLNKLTFKDVINYVTDQNKKQNK